MLMKKTIIILLHAYIYVATNFSFIADNSIKYFYLITQRRQWVIHVDGPLSPAAVNAASFIVLMQFCASSAYTTDSFLVIKFQRNYFMNWIFIVSSSAMTGFNTSLHVIYSNIEQFMARITVILRRVYGWRRVDRY